ncbi:MAG TPA: hypothetical protein VHT34_12495 [Clostridia bacterium]|nr:hypothetical protein [Clostridia bacterium]
MNIIYAGYGAVKTVDVSNKVRSAYNSGQKVFEASNAMWGDPDVGQNKSLFIIYVYNGVMYTAAATEPHVGNVHTITLP